MPLVYVHPLNQRRDQNFEDVDARKSAGRRARGRRVGCGRGHGEECRGLVAVLVVPYDASKVRTRIHSDSIYRYFEQIERVEPAEHSTTFVWQQDGGRDVRDADAQVKQSQPF